jgi:hypothetical protein
MIYTWKADAPVRFDFHTVPDGMPTSESERFEAGESTEISGVYTAPYAGLHGWWWENTGTRPVTIRVQSAGFYSQAMMFGGGGIVWRNSMIVNCTAESKTSSPVDGGGYQKFSSDQRMLRRHSIQNTITGQDAIRFRI